MYFIQPGGGSHVTKCERHTGSLKGSQKSALPGIEPGSPSIPCWCANHYTTEQSILRAGNGWGQWNTELSVHHDDFPSPVESNLQSHLWGKSVERGIEIEPVFTALC